MNNVSHMVGSQGPFCPLLTTHGYVSSFMESLHLRKQWFEINRPITLWTWFSPFDLKPELMGARLEYHENPFLQWTRPVKQTRARIAYNNPNEESIDPSFSPANDST